MRFTPVGQGSVKGSACRQVRHWLPHGCERCAPLGSVTTRCGRTASARRVSVRADGATTRETRVGTSDTGGVATGGSAVRPARCRIPTQDCPVGIIEAGRRM